MNTTKRVLIFFVCLLALSPCVFAAEGTITDMKTDCAIAQNGICQITQTVTIDITGIERDLEFPLAEGAKKASIAGYHARKSADGECVTLVLHNDAGFSGARTFTLLYSLDKMISEADGVQTLTLPLLYPKWDFPITRYSFTISLPKPFESMPAFSSGYYGDVIEDYMDVKVSAGLIRGEVPDGLLDHESLTMTLDVESGYFSGTYASWSVNWVATLLIAVFSFLTVLYWFLFLRSPFVRSSPRPVPPDAVLPGDLPLLLAGARPDFNMLVCHWAQLGYLTISVNKKGHIRLQKRVDMGNERRRLEQKLFSALFVRGDTCYAESLVYKRAAQTSFAAIPSYWNRRLYQKTSGSAAIMRLLCAIVGGITLFSTMSLLLPVMALRWLLLIGSFLLGAALSVLIQLGPQALVLHRALQLTFAAAAAVVQLVLSNLAESFPVMLLAVVLSIFTGIMTLHGGKRTQTGAQFISQVMGFRRFLRKQDEKSLRSQLYRDGQYFYRMLPYAEAMGIGRDFARQFGNLELETCDWYTESKPLPRTAPEFYDRLSQTLDILSLSIRK